MLAHACASIVLQHFAGGQTLEAPTEDDILEDMQCDYMTKDLGRDQGAAQYPQPKNARCKVPCTHGVNCSRRKHPQEPTAHQYKGCDRCEDRYWWQEDNLDYMQCDYMTKTLGRGCRTSEQGEVPHTQGEKCTLGSGRTGKPEQYKQEPVFCLWCGTVVPDSQFGHCLTCGHWLTR